MKKMISKNNTRILWLDVETTGLDPEKHDIIELSALIEINGEVVDTHKYYVRPENWDNIDRVALEVGKHNIHDLETYPDGREVFRKIMDSVSEYLGNGRNDRFIIAGYNTEFDVSFFKNFFARYDDVSNFSIYFSHRVIDVLKVVWFMQYFGFANFQHTRLSDICDFFSIYIDPHDSMSDIVATRTLCDELTKYLSSL